MGDGTVFLFSCGLAAEATYVNGESLNVLVPRMIRKREIHREQALARAKDDYSYEKRLLTEWFREHEATCSLALEAELEAALVNDDYEAAELLDPNDYEAQKKMERNAELHWFESDGEEEVKNDEEAPEEEAADVAAEGSETKP